MRPNCEGPLYSKHTLMYYGKLMSAYLFIQSKSGPLKWYVDAYLDNKLEYQELSIMVWDILEEWNQIDSSNELLSLKEQMFWHLLLLIQRWPDQQLRGNLFIRQQLQSGATYLVQGGPVPFACEALRP